MNKTKHTPGPWQVDVYETKNAANPRQVTVGATGMTIRVSGLIQHQDANARLIAAAPELLASCEVLWSELKNKLAGISLKTGLDGPCILHFLDKTIYCASVNEAITKSDELMAEEFPDVYAAIAAAKGEVS